jgi:DNA repair exonuclease SbcCD ATPase subunit
VSWFLEEISIEGFRGINNAGSPLELKFHPDKVNSVFAPNGVGKSSIFEAVTYALTGAIPKLDALPAAERSASYYLNRFHPADLGTVSLTLRGVSDGVSLTVTVTRDLIGTRTVRTSDGRDGNVVLAELNREFVLLDAKTFQNCQSARKFDPSSASNFDPFERRCLTVALGSSELAGVAETRRARVA